MANTPLLTLCSAYLLLFSPRSETPGFLIQFDEGMNLLLLLLLTGTGFKIILCTQPPHRHTAAVLAALLTSDQHTQPYSHIQHTYFTDHSGPLYRIVLHLLHVAETVSPPLTGLYLTACNHCFCSFFIAVPIQSANRFFFSVTFNRTCSLQILQYSTTQPAVLVYHTTQLFFSTVQPDVETHQTCTEMYSTSWLCQFFLRIN